MKINQLSASNHGKEMSYKFHLRCSLIKSFVVGMGRHCLLDKRSLGGQLVGLAIRCSNRSGKHKKKRKRHLGPAMQWPERLYILPGDQGELGIPFKTVISSCDKMKCLSH